VPTQYVLDGDTVLVHLLARNPVWDAIAENPTVLLAVSGDWAFVPSSWKAIGDEDPRLGIPTTYYASVQLTGAATSVDDPDEIAALLRTQLAALQPEEDVVDPAEHGARLRVIRGLRMRIDDVRAKFKYAGNVDRAHREAALARLLDRDRPGDADAAAHLRRRIDR
jgi:transcriptional regulator